jgi:hypothetical protein
MKYSDYLIAVATERKPETTTQTPIRNPSNFLQALYLHIAHSNEPISREGTDRMMDSLFAHPDMQALLDPVEATKFQTDFAATYLPTLPTAYQTFWVHIVLPAWGQHQAIYQVIKRTEEPTNPESCCTETDS